MTCTACAMGFFADPLKLSIVLGSFAISLLFFALVQTHKDARARLGFVYAHIFTLIFPFAFFVLFRGCQRLFTTCDSFDKILILIGSTAVISLLIGLLIGPLLFLRKYQQNSRSAKGLWIGHFVHQQARRLHVGKVSVYVIDMAKPLAFSLRYMRASIYVSVGLLDILKRKETQAVLYHELHHIQNNDSLMRLSWHAMRSLSPIALLSKHDSSDEEKAADTFAIKAQRTDRHIRNARKKIDTYYKQA